MAQNNKNELSIQVHLNGLSFCILDNSNKAIIYLKTVNFGKKLTPFDTLTRLKSVLGSESVFSNDFSSIKIIHQNELATQVPNLLYDDNLKADYLKFNSKLLSTDFLATDKISVIESTNIYVPYVNINNYIFDNFGEFVFKHASSILIEKALSISNEDLVFLYVNATHFELIVIQNKHLQLYNYFEYITKEDFIYYVLFVFEQLQLSTEQTKVTLCGAINKNDALYNMLYTYVRHVDILNFNYSFETSEIISDEKLHHHFLILNAF